VASFLITSAALAAASAPVSTAGAAARSAATTSAAALPKCPTTAIKKGQTVGITFWESAIRANLTTLQGIAKRYNASQSQVHVTLVTQNGYDDTWQKYEAGLSTGQLPNVVQLEDQRTQVALDTGSVLPVQSCINATDYPTADFLARPLSYWRVGGQQVAMPFAVSAPVLYYNQLSFTKAHLDPATPPATLPQMLSDAAALKAVGIGTGLVLDPWHLETWLATANQLFVDNKNGRSGRATHAVFGTRTAEQIFTDLDTLVKSGDAVTNPSSGPSAVDNLIGIGTGKYGMTIDTSADLGTISVLLAGGHYPNVKLGVGAFPALSPSVRGGVEPGGSGVYIVAKGSTPAKIEASWKFVSYLESTQSVATWAAGTGYIPTRRSSVTTPTIKRLWAASPYYKVAYNEILNGVASPATAGSVIGPYEDVRTDVLNAETSMFTAGVSPKQALSTALQNVNATLAQYNQRLGVS